jgi:hypothetical protein
MVLAVVGGDGLGLLGREEIGSAPLLEQPLHHPIGSVLGRDRTQVIRYCHQSIHI